MYLIFVGAGVLHQQALETSAFTILLASNGSDWKQEEAEVCEADYG